jgi:hypothetical protein
LNFFNNVLLTADIEMMAVLNVTTNNSQSAFVNFSSAGNLIKSL